jgi:hypothetical protein
MAAVAVRARPRRDEAAAAGRVRQRAAAEEAAVAAVAGDDVRAGNGNS